MRWNTITNENYELKLKNIAFIGNYLPRKCGIATFTTDLLQAVSNEAPEISCWALTMNDKPQGYSYPKQVRFELYDKRLGDYELAAEFLNVNKVDLVCLQHEFGIYGGDFGKYILALIRNLRMPIVTTLHSILPNPHPQQKKIIETINQISDKIVVMSKKAKLFLNEVYGVANEKITLIHHGIPDVPFIDPNFFKDQFGVEGKDVILTFGLLNPGKGIEFMIEALPEIIQKYPDVIYIVLGATHPNIIKEQGEKYRHSLQRKARDLGVENNILFHNRFVDLEELCEFLGAANVYVSPYINKDQIISGTLAYAIGAGKAIISTPYWYAEESLAGGRGIIVPFKNHKLLAKAIIDLLDNETERHAMRKKAYLYSREMIWKQVATEYLKIFHEILKKREIQPIIPIQKKSLRVTPFEVPIPKFDHLYRLTDDVGILQHANFIITNRDDGYCTDDNARALIAVLMAQNLSIEDKLLKDLDCRYLSFLLHSFNQKIGRFRNFLGYNHKWLERKGSEDSHGRSVWALGITIGLAKIKEFGDISLEIFERAVSTLTKFNYPRSLAFGLVGIHAYLARFSGDSRMKRYRKLIANKLFKFYRDNASNDWSWLENTITYDNGKIPQALLMSGKWMQRGDMIEAGLDMLDWLIKIQIGSKGQFSPIGNKGWYSRGGEKARFDQQPLEAQSILEACIEAFNITQDKRWIIEARRCFEWFLGRNDMNIPLYDYKTGGCYDSLTSIGFNRNQGAESTVAWLLSLLNMYYLESLIDIDEKLIKVEKSV
ncbi:MAG: glycosyltransferase family 4 protein [Candidatus Hodarchaeota archaeon]